jgi:hypothetical protein
MSAIIDVQGFKNECNEFIPKELAIISKDGILVVLIKPPYPFYFLTKKERKQVAWLEKNRGILWNDGYVSYCDYKSLLLNFCKNKHIYVKGYEKVVWVKEMVESDNVLNLEDINCPNLEKLSEKYSSSSDIKHCIYHTNKCALKNASFLNKWCIENNIFI